MDYVKGILDEARIQTERYKCNSPSTIWLTAAHQLIASYSVLTRFAETDQHYRGWHAHHVFEYQDLERLGVAAKFPPYNEQLTVLLPRAAHVKRINSDLRIQAPMGAVMKAQELVSAYASAYSLMGDYCGGGEVKIRTELLAVVKTTLRRAGLA